MMRALFVSLSVSLLAGCAAAPAGESAEEDLLAADLVEGSEPQELGGLSAVRFECPLQKCRKAEVLRPEPMPWESLEARPVLDRHHLAAPGADMDAARGAAEAEEEGDLAAFSSAVTFHAETPFYIPPHVGGDTDFGGHGPRVYLAVELHVFNGNEVWASVHMDAIETKSDWTRAEGTGWFHLYTAPRGIAEILGPTYFEHEYVDTDHARDLYSFSPGNLVSLLDHVGDTRGNEAGSRTGVQVVFQPITLGLQ